MYFCPRHVGVKGEQSTTPLILNLDSRWRWMEIFILR